MQRKRIVALLLIMTFLMGLMSVAHAAVTPKSVKLDRTRMDVIGGAPFKLKATVSPANASQIVIWSSSNPSVATVSSSGVVTAKSPGTTTITAKTVVGNKTATCQVTVPRTKSYSKTYTVATGWPYYMKDIISVIVDGTTGKIVGADVYQSKWDDGLIGKIHKEGASVTYKCDDYVEVRTRWSVDAGIWKLSLKFADVECRYRMYKDGSLVLLSKRNI